MKLALWEGPASSPHLTTFHVFHLFPPLDKNPFRKKNVHCFLWFAALEAFHLEVQYLKSESGTTVDNQTFIPWEKNSCKGDKNHLQSSGKGNTPHSCYMALGGPWCFAGMLASLWVWVSGTKLRAWVPKQAPHTHKKKESGCVLSHKLGGDPESSLNWVTGVT